MRPYQRPRNDVRPESDTVPVAVAQSYVRGPPGTGSNDSQMFTTSKLPGRPSSAASGASYDNTVRASQQAAANVDAMEAMIRKLTFQDAPDMSVSNKKKTEAATAPMAGFLDEMDRTLRAFV